jgi:hypothetical protein
MCNVRRRDIEPRMDPRKEAEDARWREERQIVDEARVKRAMTTTDDGETVWRRAWDQEKASAGRKQGVANTRE